MCEGSIYVAHRLATAHEDLVVRQIPNYSLKGLYPADPSVDDRLVCIRRPQVEIVIDKVTVDHRWVRSGPLVQRWNGATNLKVRLHHEVITFPDGQRAHLSWLMAGTRVRLGMPVITGLPGMNKVAMAIEEGIATEPTPMPVPEPVKEPAPTPPEPVEEPQPGTSQPETARRRLVIV
jgi:hypothetical protein